MLTETARLFHFFNFLNNVIWLLFVCVMRTGGEVWREGERGRGHAAVRPGPSHREDGRLLVHAHQLQVRSADITAATAPLSR